MSNFRPHLLFSNQGDQLHVRVFIPNLDPADVTNQDQLSNDLSSQIIHIEEFDSLFIRVELSVNQPNTQMLFWDNEGMAFEISYSEINTNNFGVVMIGPENDEVVAFTFNKVIFASPSDHDSDEGPFICSYDDKIYSITKLSGASGDQMIPVNGSELDHNLVDGSEAYQALETPINSVSEEYEVFIKKGSRKPKRKAKSSVALASDPRVNLNIV